MFSSDTPEGESQPQLVRVVLWANGAVDAGDQLSSGGATPRLEHSIVQGTCPVGATCDTVIHDDPLLGPLEDNGGFTETRAPGAAGSAVDAAPSLTCPPTDQRGVSRPLTVCCSRGRPP